MKAESAAPMSPSQAQQIQGQKEQKGKAGANLMINIYVFHVIIESHFLLGLFLSEAIMQNKAQQRSKR